MKTAPKVFIGFLVTCATLGGIMNFLWVHLPFPTDLIYQPSPDSSVLLGTRKHELYDYWVCYDPQTQQALWRTDFHSESISSLLPFITL